MAEYNSIYTGEQIDSGVGRALPNGELDQKIAQATSGGLFDENPIEPSIVMRGADGKYAYGRYIGNGITTTNLDDTNKLLRVNGFIGQAYTANDGYVDTILYRVVICTSAQYASIEVPAPNYIYLVSE